eukprot:COSAG01_NODE_4228_length_5224_cov_2.652488_1_plen_73_part_00
MSLEAAATAPPPSAAAPQRGGYSGWGTSPDAVAPPSPVPGSPVPAGRQRRRRRLSSTEWKSLSPALPKRFAV